MIHSNKRYRYTRLLPVVVALALNPGCLQEFPQTNNQDALAMLYLLESTTTATSPESISDLGLWFKADALTATSGQAIGSWTDSSGFDRHATNGTGSEQPTFQANVLNGQPALYFDGSDDFLQTSDVEYETVTYMAVARFTKNWNPGWGTFGYRMSVLAQFGDNPNNASSLYFNWKEVSGVGQARISLRTRIEGVGSIFAGSTVSQNQWYLISSEYDGQYSRTFLGGTLQAQSAYTAGSIRNSSLGFTIGKHDATSGGTNNHRFEGYIAEIILYTKSLSESERQGVECYLGLKYNLSAGAGCT